MTLVCELNQYDFDPQIQFCEYFSEKLIFNTNFLHSTGFLDERTFMLNDEVILTIIVSLIHKDTNYESLFFSFSRKFSLTYFHSPLAKENDKSRSQTSLKESSLQIKLTHENHIKKRKLKAHQLE